MNEQNKILDFHNKLINSNYHDFPISGNVIVTNKQGVYIIYSKNIDVLHVGKTDSAKNGLNQRLSNHLQNKSSFNKLFMQTNNISLRGWGKFQYIEVENARERALVEALTIGLLCPAHIGTGEKNNIKK